MSSLSPSLLMFFKVVKMYKLCNEEEVNNNLRLEPNEKSDKTIRQIKQKGAGNRGR